VSVSFLVTHNMKRDACTASGWACLALRAGVLQAALSVFSAHLSTWRQFLECGQYRTVRWLCVSFCLSSICCLDGIFFLPFCAHVHRVRPTSHLVTTHHHFSGIHPSAHPPPQDAHGLLSNHDGVSRSATELASFCSHQQWQTGVASLQCR
jgi:hypothetical protein